MPKPYVPAYRRHAGSGQGVVTLTDAVTRRRRDIYLGPHNSPASLDQYEVTIARWLRAGRRLDSEPTTTIGDVVKAYKARVEATLSPSAAETVGVTLGVLEEHYGTLPAAAFGPKRLLNLRERFIARGWTRKSINSRTRTVVNAFSHAVVQELVEAGTADALKHVQALKRGETDAPEGKAVKPVPLPHVEAIRPHLSPQVCAMIDVQLYTGARPGEVCAMRLIDIEAAGKVWTYRPATHKNLWRGKDRQVFLGPRAQAVLQPFLRGRAMDAPLFSPREANAARKAQAAQAGRRDDQPPSPRKTERTIGDQYDVTSYRRAIARACESAGVPKWSPHQLRHTAATQIRKEHSLEAAALILGHASATITDAVYAERDTAKARDVIAKVG